MDAEEPTATRSCEEESPALFAEFVTASRRNNVGSKTFGGFSTHLLLRSAYKSEKGKMF